MQIQDTYMHTYKRCKSLPDTHKGKAHFVFVSITHMHTHILQILHDVTTDVRPFLTNAGDELVFLEFVDKLSAISDALAAYSTYAGTYVCMHASMRIYLPI